MYKRLLAVCLTLAVMLLPSLGLAAKEPPAAWPLLKIDSHNTPELPRSFRTTSDSLPAGYAPAGLAALHASGSSQFSELQLATMLPRFSGTVYIVDLRQEAHGFLDGTAVSWYGERNWENRGKTLPEITALEQERLAAAQNGAPLTVATLHKHKGKVTTSTQEMLVTHALSEAQLAELYGVRYYRIPATDHIRPSNENVDQFLAWYKTLPADAWLHFHCHAGHGRTTTFLIMYDILRNHQVASLEEIVARQAALGGIDVLNTPPSKEGWQKTAYEERAVFVRQFYEYVHQSPAELPQTWSAWLEQQPQ